MSSKTERRAVLVAIGLALLATSARAEEAWRPDRIIDVHLHGYATQEGWHDLPMGVGAHHVPAEFAERRPPPTPSAHRDAILGAMERNGIVLGLMSAGHFSDPNVGEAWKTPIAEGRILLGATHRRVLDDRSRSAVEKEARAGELRFLGEWGLVYDGLEPDDPRLAEAWALAERLDLPVGVHTGTAAPGSANRGEPGFRNRLGNPALLEDVLVRHPKLRLWLMHAGYPYLEDTIAMLHQYPEVYADISPLNWLLPEAEFRRYVGALVTAGFADRLMFGTDAMRWPDAIDVAVERTARLPFLTEDQKRDLFHRNAERFFRLESGAE